MEHSLGTSPFRSRFPGLNTLGALWVVCQSGVPQRAAMSPAFTGYAALLGHVNANRFLGKVVVRGTNAPRKKWLTTAPSQPESL